jgi:D-alanyl-D-alanine carboxypeptidase
VKIIKQLIPQRNYLYRILGLSLAVPLITFILSAECIGAGDRADARLASQLQTVLEEQRHLYGIPGISAALITSKNQKWLGVSGYSSEKDSLKPEMVFGLGSVTKTYIAALVLKLSEEGKLSLDDPIKRWLPDMRFVDSTITIHQLLNHTSGLYRYQGKPEWLEEVVKKNPDKIWSPKEIIDNFVKEPACKPGACWDESAADYVLLGMIIEKATGQKAANLLKERIISPLKLKHTCLYPDETYPSEQFAHFWWDVNSSGKLVDVFPDGAKIPFAAFFSSVWTSGAMISTAEDLAIFSKALFENKVLSDTSLRKMVTPIQLGNSPKYGFSVVIDTVNGKTVYWHTGGIGYTSVFYYIPDDKLTIAVLCNSFVDPKPIAVALYNKYKELGD